MTNAREYALIHRSLSYLGVHLAQNKQAKLSNRTTGLFHSSRHETQIHEATTNIAPTETLQWVLSKISTSEHAGYGKRHLIS